MNVVISVKQKTVNNDFDSYFKKYTTFRQKKDLAARYFGTEIFQMTFAI